VPKETGSKYELPKKLAPLAPFRDKLSIFSGSRVFMDGEGLVPHQSGMQGMLWGDPTKKANDPSIDVLVADMIGSRTRFRSVEACATGKETDSASRRSASVRNASETSPAALYTRLFGPEFRDPNAADFKPDPKVMLRKSVLSAVADSRNSLVSDLGAADKVRLDEYFTSLRELEQRVDLQLQKPEPLQACTLPEAVQANSTGTVVEVMTENNSLFADLMAHALACGQTQVFNMFFNGLDTRKAGDARTHHTLTHEEPVDAALGYQPTVNWFEDRVIDNFGRFLTALSRFREGDRTLLDRTLIFAPSETGYAKVHALENIPVFVVGNAGRWNIPGTHFRLTNEPGTRIGLTVQQAMGVSIAEWGSGSNKTSNIISGILS
jgi:hypothetical protein